MFYSLFQHIYNRQSNIYLFISFHWKHRYSSTRQKLFYASSLSIVMLARSYQCYCFVTFVQIHVNSFFFCLNIYYNMFLVYWFHFKLASRLSSVASNCFSDIIHCLSDKLNDAKDDENKRKETEVYYLYMLAHLYTL